MSKDQLEKVEALQAASPLFGRVIGAIKGLIGEYQDGKSKDTDEYMHSILQSLEWTFSVYRSTKDMVNARGSINQDEVNAAVIRLNAANQADDDSEKIEAFKSILTFVETFKKEADSIVANTAA